MLEKQGIAKMWQLHIRDMSENEMVHEGLKFALYKFFNVFFLIRPNTT